MQVIQLMCCAQFKSFIGNKMLVALKLKIRQPFPSSSLSSFHFSIFLRPVKPFPSYLPSDRRRFTGQRPKLPKGPRLPHQNFDVFSKYLEISKTPSETRIEVADYKSELTFIFSRRYYSDIWFLAVRGFRPLAVNPSGFGRLPLSLAVHSPKWPFKDE